MFLMITVIIGVLLLVAGIMDLKRKSISRGMIALLMAVCISGIFFKSTFSIGETIGGLLIGLCAVGLSVGSKEQIGRGDGLVICAIGMVLGFRECLFTVCTASVIMALVSIGVLILRKGNKNTRLPFIPALFIAYTACMVMEI